MDTKTLNLFDDVDGDEKLKEMMKRMGEFIAYFEVAEEKMSQWKRDVEQSIQDNQVTLNEQLDDIREVANELRDVMTEAGVARWRLAAESALQEGKDHIKTLESTSKNHLDNIHAANEEFNKLAKKSFDRLDRASAYTIKNISEAVSSFRINDFQRMAEQSCELVQETSASAISRLRDLVKWFHWKNLGLAFAITIFATITVGLYLSDEMPWEIHKQVVAQRNVGQAVLSAWHDLQETDKELILQHAKKEGTLT